MSIVESTKYVIFYQDADEKVFSYQQFNFLYDDVAEQYINIPEKQQCADNEGIDPSGVGLKKWNFINPSGVDFKNYISELNPDDLEDLG